MRHKGMHLILHNYAYTFYLPNITLHAKVPQVHLSASVFL